MFKKHAFLIISPVLAGCAFNIAELEQYPTQLTSSACENSFVVHDNTLLKNSYGFDRTLKKDSVWKCVGSITQGKIYKSDEQILTVEVSNIYEARLVVKGDYVTGYYLPVEKTFSPIKSPIRIIE